MEQNFGTEMYDNKYRQKEETSPRSVVVYFVDNFLTPGQHCLDLGCGAGRHSKYMVEKGINVTAVDLSEEGVRKTQEILADFPNSRAELADIHYLPFPAGSFDSLISNRVLDYNDDNGLDEAFSEISRVLKGGSMILITVRSASQLSKVNEFLVNENELGGQTYSVQSGAEAGAYQHYFTEQEIRKLAEGHGLTVEDIREERKEAEDGRLKAEWQVVMKKKDTQK